MPPACKPSGPPTLPPTRWTEDSSPPSPPKTPLSQHLHLPSLLLTHSQVAHVPKAALRDHGEHEQPRGVCSRPQEAQPEPGGLMALCPEVDCPLGDLDPGSSGSWRLLSSQLSVFSFPCTSPPPPSATARPPGSPFNQQTTPTARTETSMEGAQNSW